MIRIRCITSPGVPIARDRITQVEDIFRENFPKLVGYAEKIPELLSNPFKHDYQTALIVSETALGKVTGFVLLLHFPAIRNSFLDFIAVRRAQVGGGLGSALYEAAREYCQALSSRGLYMEVQPDDPNLTNDPAELAQSRKRMRFYEHYGVRPIVGTAYHTPAGDPPTTAYLLFDPLDRTSGLSRAEAQDAVRAILSHRFRHIVDEHYIRRVVESFVDDPVRFRPPRYVQTAERVQQITTGHIQKHFALVASQKHALHHVRSRGYFERPVRVGALLDAILPLNLFTMLPPKRFSEKTVLAVHDRHFVNYLKTVCTRLEIGRPVYPDTFPIRRPDRRPRDFPVQAGYYCIDSCTPLYRNAYLAARASVDVAMTAAEELLAGARVAYALCRPPGHHAERKVYGGFCYFNNAAIAAHQLSLHGRTAVLDIDFHHGNGTQDIFYARPDVLTVSIHGHPDYSFPYFSGFAGEKGEGPGLGFNRNFPLPPKTDDARYLNTFDKALARIERFRPDFLVVSFGLDVLKGDPTGTFMLSVDALRQVGRSLGQLGHAMLVVQEGGYNLRNLKRGAVVFFRAISDAIRPTHGLL
jgi:acetoin utilization deacetylase AcuC-like enzyme/GNAT superfamily N-acetyltransferase